MADRGTFVLLAAAVAAAYVAGEIGTQMGDFADYVAVAGYVVSVALLVLAIAGIVTGRPFGEPGGVSAGWALAGFVGITAAAAAGLHIANGERIFWTNLTFVIVVAVTIGLFALLAFDRETERIAEKGSGAAKPKVDLELKRRFRRRRRARHAERATEAEDGDDNDDDESDRE